MGWVTDVYRMHCLAAQHIGHGPADVQPRGNAGDIIMTDLHRLGWIDEYQSAMEAIMEIMTPDNIPGLTHTPIYVAGFSQGAALTYSIALTRPQRVKALAGLAGFMPQGAEALARNQPLAGRAAFIAHGTLDEIVPVERARKAVEILKLSGADVTYCEDDVTHKMSAECFKDFAVFFDFHANRDGGR